MLKGYRDAQVAWLVCSGGGSEAGGGGSGGGGSSGGAWAPRLGSSSSLGEGSVGGGSLRSSAADLAGLQHQHQEEDEEEEASSDQGGAPEGQQQQQTQAQAQESGKPAVPPGGLLLVAYAPRRAAVELWEPHSLSRVGSMRCATQLGLLLQQPAQQRAAGVGGGSGRPAPNKLLLLDASSCAVADLTAPLNALVMST